MFTMATVEAGDVSFGSIELITVGRTSLGYRDSHKATERAIVRARETGKAFKVLTVGADGRYGLLETVDPDGSVFNETFG